MPFDPDKHHRRSIRLVEYDYRQAGMYAVTLVTHHRQCLFGDVVDGEVLLSTLGCIVDECWEAIPQHIPYIELDTFMVMPNHIHGILVIQQGGNVCDFDPLGEPKRIGDMQHPGESMPRPYSRTSGNPARSLGGVIASFKSIATKRINQMRQSPGLPVWQRNYYEHIIRNEHDLREHRQYILNKPAKWIEDTEYIDDL